MSEPCKHERSDAITSFITANRAAVRAEATVARVVVLRDQYDAAGMDVPTCELTKVIEGES